MSTYFKAQDEVALSLSHSATVDAINEWMVFSDDVFPRSCQKLNNAWCTRSSTGQTNRIALEGGDICKLLCEMQRIRSGCEVDGGWKEAMKYPSIFRTEKQ